MSEAEEGRARINRHEIPDMLSWLQCFSLYTAVVGNKFPEKVQDLWAYQATIIAVVWWQRVTPLRCWVLAADRFHRVSGVRKAESGSLCHHFPGLWHCWPVLWQLPTDRPLPGRLCPELVQVVRLREPSRERREGGRSGEHSTKRRRRGASYAWNDGRCSSPNCHFDHICLRCHSTRGQCVAVQGEGQCEGRGVGLRPPPPKLALTCAIICVCGIVYCGVLQCSIYLYKVHWGASGKDRLRSEW